MTSVLTTERAPLSPLAGPVRAARARIAVAGCGVVGTALLQLLNETDAQFPHEIVSVLVRDPVRRRDCAVSERVITSALDDFLDCDAQIVVEALGGVEPANTIAEHTLSRGRTFITANKALVAACGAHLRELASKHGGTFRFDAAVGGGVPVIRLLESSLGNRRPRAVRGILNGTSNFVLTLLERGASFESAIAIARKRGFAEADVSRDLDGRDAADKIAILAWRAFGLVPHEVLVRRRGLPADPARLVTLAAELGGSARIIAECELLDDGHTVVASVEPVIVPSDSGFARTLFEENRVEVDAGWSAPLTTGGPGAGGLPTATALLSDLLAPSAESDVQSSSARAAHDGRLLHWVIAARCSTEVLRSVLREASVPWRDLSRAGDEAVVRTRPLPFFAVERALVALEQLVAAPIVVRLDDGFAWETAA
jgi:homoserine dehydrogenase